MKKQLYIYKARYFKKNCMYTQVPIILKGIEAGKGKKFTNFYLAKKRWCRGLRRQERSVGSGARPAGGAWETEEFPAGRAVACFQEGGATQIRRPLLPGPDMRQTEAAQKPTDIRNPVVVSDRVVSWSELPARSCTVTPNAIDGVYASKYGEKSWIQGSLKSDFSAKDCLTQIHTNRSSPHIWTYYIHVSSFCTSEWKWGTFERRYVKTYYVLRCFFCVCTCLGTIDLCAECSWVLSPCVCAQWVFLFQFCNVTPTVLF